MVDRLIDDTSNDSSLNDHESTLVIVERTGLWSESKMFNGKYVYSTTTEQGYPIFEHSDNGDLLIGYNNDKMRWEFLNEKEVYYYAKSDDKLPPSSGWSKTRKGKLPYPVIRLEKRSKETLESMVNNSDDDQDEKMSILSDVTDPPKQPKSDEISDKKQEITMQSKSIFVDRAGTKKFNGK